MMRRMGIEIKAFLVHLRLHYQFLILSGAFLSGAVFSRAAFTGALLLQFLSVHVLLFGGVTVYNSYWDKDTGPIGGLRRPPPLAAWTLPASWVLQGVGLAISIGISSLSAAVYAASMGCFWLYSGPRSRWKGRPWLSLMGIGAGTGVCGFLLGYLYDGRGSVSLSAVAGALAVACLIVSMFPMSQAYQVEEDLGRRDATFAARFGLAGIRRCYAVLFPFGVIALAVSLASMEPWLGGVLLILGAFSGAGVWRVIRDLRMDSGEYPRIMAVKYLASGLFSVFLGSVLALRWQGLFPGK
jgi:1,4-dihydroxy-2-naphthoate octaprenyltransferase